MTSVQAYPASGASLANAGTSENANAWVSPGNVGSSSAVASITAATFDSPDISEILVASNFGFNISTDNILDGILVEISKRGYTNANSGKDFRVQLGTGTAFANLVGNNKASANVWPQTTRATTSYGGSTDTWGTSLTLAQINAAGFAVFLSAYANVANADIDVDWIRVTVYFHAPVTGSLTADAVIKRTISPTGWAADATQKKTQGAVFYIGNNNGTGGAVITVPATTYTFTDKKADAVLFKGMAGSFTSDAVIKRLNQPGSGTANAVLLRNSGTLTFTVGAVLKRTQLPTVTSDAVIKRFDQLGSGTANAVLLRNSGTKTSTADAVIKRTQLPTLTADAVIKKTITPTANADAVIFKSSGTKTFSADAVLLRVQPASFAAAAVIKKLGVAPTPLTANAIVKRTQLSTATADAIRLRTMVFSGGAALSASDTFNRNGTLAGTSTDTGSRTWARFWRQDSSLDTLTTSTAAGYAYQTGSSVTGFDFIGAGGAYTGDITQTVDGLNAAVPWGSTLFARGVGSSCYYCTEGDLNRLTNGVYTTLGSAGGIGGRTRLTVTGSSPTRLQVRTWNSGGSEPGTWDLDVNDNTAANQATSGLFGIGTWSYDDFGYVSYTQDSAWTASSTLAVDGPGITIDAILLKARTGSFTANAVIKRTQLPTLTANAIKRKTISGSFGGGEDGGINAWLVAGVTVVPGSAAADAILRREQAGSLTADAVLKRTVAPTPFAVDAVLTKTITPTGKTADAVLLKNSGTKTVTADAVLFRNSGTKTGTANAIVLRGSGTKTATADAVLRIGRSGTATADAIVKRTQLGSPTADAILRREQAGSLTADAVLSRVQTADLTASAVLLRARAGSVSADATIKKTLTPSASTDAIKLRTYWFGDAGAGF